MSPIAKTWKAVANKVVNKKTVQVGFVQSTDTWKRTGNLSSKVQSQFNKKVEENANLIKSNAVGVYLQETPHQSDKDKRNHFTAVQVDKNNKVIATSHFPTAPKK